MIIFTTKKDIIMERYVRYERIRNKFTSEEINNKFKELITEGWEIIDYSEQSLGKEDDVEKFLVTIICGKLNKGNKQIL